MQAEIAFAHAIEGSPNKLTQNTTRDPFDKLRVPSQSRDEIVAAPEDQGRRRFDLGMRRPRRVRLMHEAQ